MPTRVSGMVKCTASDTTRGRRRVGGGRRHLHRPGDHQLVDLRRRRAFEQRLGAEVGADPFGQPLGVGALRLGRQRRFERARRERRGGPAPRRGGDEHKATAVAVQHGDETRDSVAHLRRQSPQDGRHAVVLVSRPMFIALRHRNFRLLWIGLLVSFSGTFMQSAAVLWHVSLLVPPDKRAIALGLVGLVRDRSGRAVLDDQRGRRRCVRSAPADAGDADDHGGARRRAGAR